MMTITTEMLIEALNMFAFLAVELTALFLVISYLVGVLQEHIPPSRIQSCTDCGRYWYSTLYSSGSRDTT